MTDEWEGIERRSTDTKLAVAIAEVRNLKDAAAKLADAVTVRTDEFQRVVQRVGMMLVALLIIIMGFSMWQVNRLTRELARGHDSLICLLLIEPVTRTAQTLIDCQRE